MVVFVPQSYVALVYAGGQLLVVLESGVGLVPHSQALEVHYVYLQPQPEYLEDGEALEAGLETVH